MYDSAKDAHHLVGDALCLVALDVSFVATGEPGAVEARKLGSGAGDRDHDRLLCVAEIYYRLAAVLIAAVNFYKIDGLLAVQLARHKTVTDFVAGETENPIVAHLRGP